MVDRGEGVAVAGEGGSHGAFPGALGGGNIAVRVGVAGEDPPEGIGEGGGKFVIAASGREGTFQALPVEASGAAPGAGGFPFDGEGEGGFSDAGAKSDGVLLGFGKSADLHVWGPVFGGCGSVVGAALARYREAREDNFAKIFFGVVLLFELTVGKIRVR